MRIKLAYGKFTSKFSRNSRENSKISTRPKIIYYFIFKDLYEQILFVIIIWLDHPFVISHAVHESTRTVISFLVKFPTPSFSGKEIGENIQVNRFS